MQIPNSGKWIGELKADLGGFGIGSQETYQIQAYGGYRFSKLFQATAGYRVLSIDYESETGGSERFNYDEKIRDRHSVGFQFLTRQKNNPI